MENRRNNSVVFFYFKCWIAVSACCFLFALHAFAQDSADNKEERFSIHAQTTIINLFKPAFNAPYTGQNSLITQKESQTSVTATLFAGARLWKGSSIFINPELAGGSGLSSALGVASDPNGETFRVGSKAPAIYLARLYFQQVFALSANKQLQESDANQLKKYIPEKYLSVTVGKLGVADFFDDNKYSHDPRTQFMSWGLMDNGAWDYAANTRGYTPSIVLEYVSTVHELRYDVSLLPLEANANDMNWNISKASSHTLEYTHRHKLGKLDGAIRLLAYFNTANMGNYRQSLLLQPVNPDITATRKYGRTKFGFGINAEQDITRDIGCFLRAGWDDGNNETWAFTEIDRTISGGVVMSGAKWKRPNDNIGIAHVASGLSDPHRAYLKAGGMGFMLGDGNLNYAWEHLTEIYYSAEIVKKYLYLGGAYQMISNPGYNKDRKGPVHVLSVRFHANI